MAGVLGMETFKRGRLLKKVTLSSAGRFYGHATTFKCLERINRGQQSVSRCIALKTSMKKLLVY
jgi:hypothetical protein